MNYTDYILQHYGWQGVALAAVIIALFLIQLWYYLVRYGKVSRFRNSRRKKKLSSEPAVSIVVPMFSEDYTYLDEGLQQPKYPMERLFAKHGRKTLKVKMRVTLSSRQCTVT